MPKRNLILLALEDATALKLMQSALKAASYATIVASDHDMLDKVIQDKNPALVLIGEQFDGSTGIESAHGILERFPSMPILLYAEQESTTLYQEVLQSGLSGCLCSPLQDDDVSRAVEGSLQRAHHLGDWLRREVRRTADSLKYRATMSESELKRYEFIFANIQDGVLILDDDNRILLMNKAMRTAFDIFGEELGGKVIADVISHPDMDSLLNRVEEQPLKYHEINFDDGRVYNAQYTPLGKFGSVITMQDISYLKQLNHMKNEFINTVSHDLRSPLTSVLGYTELLQRGGSLSEQQAEFLNRIRIGINSITTLVNELLDLTRLEAGFDVRREIVNLENILRFALDTIDSQLKLRNITVQTDISKSIPALRGNPIRLRQLLDNLIGNATKYSSDNSTIRISLQAEDDQIILSVSDEGTGIPKQEQARIFEKFYRASNVSSNIEGSGLGLAIVKSIVEAHQGRIWVESETGKGSSFFVVLPAYKPEK